MQNEFTIKLKTNELQLVVNALREMPHKMVDELLANLMQQVNPPKAPPDNKE